MLQISHALQIIKTIQCKLERWHCSNNVYVFVSNLGTVSHEIKILFLLDSFSQDDSIHIRKAHFHLIRFSWILNSVLFFCDSYNRHQFLYIAQM